MAFVPLYPRLLRATDRAQFIELRLKALETDPLAFGTERAEELQYVSRRFDIIMNNSSDFALGCFNAEKMVAKLCFNRERRKRTRHKGNIWGMYVLPEFRCKGLGDSLLGLAIEELRKFGDLRKVRLVVVEGNAFALQLYRKHGFILEYTEHEAYQLSENRFLDLLHLKLEFRH